MKTIIDHMALEYRDEGKGMPLVLLHGWGASLHSWDTVAPILATKYRVIRIGLPGFGESETPAEPWDVASYVDVVEKLLKKLEVEPFAFIGHSFGGRIILKGFGTGRLRSKRVVLIGSAGIRHKRTIRMLAYAIVAKIGKIVTWILPAHMRLRLRRALRMRASADYANAGILRETFLNAIREDLAGYAPSISVPTLLIWGDHDDMSPPADGERFHELIPGSEFHLILGAGHSVHQEKTQEVTQLIERFLTA